MSEIFVLLVLFELKHFAADYPLQTSYMLGKFNGKADWVLPLTAHAGVHAFMTLAITSYFVAPSLALKLSAFDFVIHFAMDSIKSSPQLLGRYQAVSSKGFWNTLGLDQAVHHLTHYVIIYWMTFA